jgi:hypothetical protein
LNLGGAAPERRLADARQFLHYDQPGALQMLPEPLGDNPRRDFLTRRQSAELPSSFFTFSSIARKLGAITFWNDRRYIIIIFCKASFEASFFIHIS